MKRPPTLPGKPFVGSLLDMRSDRIGVLMRAARLGEVVHLHFPTQESCLLSHPDHARRVLVDRHKSYGKKTRGYDALRLGLGQGLVTSEGSFWRRQRRIAQPAFHRRRIAAFGEIMARATVDMLARWQESCERGRAVDVDAEMMALTLRIVGECLLGTDLTDNTDSVAKAVTTLLEGVISRITDPLALPLDWPTPENRRLSAALENLDRVVLGAIAQRRREPPRDRDLLDMLLHAVDEETGERMTDKQLRDEVMTIVLAGHETTANALTWTLMLLSRFPAVADRVRAELAEVLGGRPPATDDLPRLVYTEAVLKESMRLYPPVWLVARSVDEPDEIGGFAIPQGWVVFVSPYVLHRDPRFWPNPEGFSPERFLGDYPKDAYLPFIAGPRKCIGDAFAMMEAQIILAAVLQRFSPELVPGQPIVENPTVTLRPKHGMRMTLRPV